jgi:prephenate dehydratase
VSAAERPRVGYPGRDGAHSAAACDVLFPDGADLVPLPSFAEVARAVAEVEVAYGVLPIESSLAGSVAETHDLLNDSALAITAEAILAIRHCLVGPAAIPLDRIRVVHSHPVALDQCRRLLAGIPQATAVAAPTTADAAAHVAELADPAQTAIASERAAALHGLVVIESDVGDHPEAYTRFVAVSTHMRLDADGDDWRTAFSFTTEHQPGALHRAIEPFARREIDLLQLVSRPIPSLPWEYRFDAVLAGHPLDEVVRGALSEVRERTRSLGVFGSYPGGHTKRTG